MLLVEVSAVIPTCNRKDELFRLLKSLENQDFVLKETIIVDSSDKSISSEELQQQFPRLNISYYRTARSVCAQRNFGILKASSSYIFLCDDDIEIPPLYVSTLIEHINKNPSVCAACGLEISPIQGILLSSNFIPIKTTTLLWNFFFQLGIWGDVEKVTLASPLNFIKRFYRIRSNTLTLAGWPLVTQISQPSFEATIYSLGWAVVRRDFLLQFPFDEILDPHGIGDHYGVAINLPKEAGITILQNLFVVHNHSPLNRLPGATSYFRRILALHYFMTCNKKFGRINRIFLCWSLVGNALYLAFRARILMVYATSKALFLIISGRNPYLHALKRKSIGPISPML